MIPDYFLQKLVEHGDKMRTLQKAFFAEKDYIKKRDLINPSKKAEREFDEVLFNVKQLLKDQVEQ